MQVTDTPRASRLEALLRQAGRSTLDGLVNILRGPRARRHTLLAVCPNSEAVTRAALSAAQKADMPLLFAATLNQVDTDGGYTGWTQASFASYVEDACQREAIDVPIFLCLDHGGPWKKDLHAMENWPYEETMAAVKDSTTACLQAGYRLLHLDPTVDRRLPAGTPVPVETIVERTVELLQHAEDVRAQAHLPPVAYEVGTEEAGGGLQGVERFTAYVDALEAALEAHHLPRPCFVVGDVGTTLASDHFNPAQAQTLAQAAERLPALIKGHYTDDVANPEAYPISGMGGANVGPGFSAVEYEALLDLVRLEEHLDHHSGFPEALRNAVIDSDRWRKWLQPDEEGRSFEELAPERQEWLIRTGSRYVWTHPAVDAARQRLYTNVADHHPAASYVRWRIETDILRYAHHFNLVGLNEQLLADLTPASAVAS